MSKNCHWALSAINYKNNDRITACPRGQTFLSNKGDSVLPSKIFNSPGFKDLRLDLYQDIWPLHCKSCMDWEKKDMPSYRTKQNDVYWHDEIFDNFDQYTGKSDNSNLEYVEFRFSNTCNFSCLHCGPEYSSTWAEIVRQTEVNEDDEKNQIINLINPVKNQNWTVEEAESVADDLVENFPNLKRLDFAGGEPLYQKQFWAFLRKIISHPNISNMDITIISNFNTLVNYEELAALLNYFKSSTVRVSVDGSKRIYKYFRTGDWDKLENNIKVFKSINKKTVLEATCTISAYQVLTMLDCFYDMYFLEVDRLHHTFVQYPTYLDPAVLKSRFQEKIYKDIEHIERFLEKEDKFDAKVRTGHSIANGLRNLFDKAKTKEEDYQKFLYYIDRMDAVKGENFDNYYDIIKKQDLKDAEPK